jgi:hypothetical protein
MNKNINLLYLIEKQQYITKMSRVRFNALQKIGEYINVVYWGPQWNNYNENISLEENLKFFDIKFDYILVFKPDVIIDFEKIKIPRIINYNEMWDEVYTLKQINSSNCDLLICHHKNDKIRYEKELFKKISNYCKIVHIPHCAEKSIFYDRNIPKTVDILLCGSIGIHYPLRERILNIIKLFPKKYICKEYKHPGYINGDAFTNIYLKDFAEAISAAKICVTCTSKYKYRLGKLVEIPMCNSVLASDIPDQDQKDFKDITLEINDSMSDKEIVDKLIFYLENEEELEKIRQKGYNWSQKFIQNYYAENFIKEMKLINKKLKVYVLADELQNMKNKWICDLLKEEFNKYSNLNIVTNPKDADIIWLLAPWATRKINKKYLEEKFVISTIHHIDWDKYEENIEYYKYIDSITNRYHTICPKTEADLRKITEKKIITTCFWINENNFYKINDKINLRKKHNIPIDAYVIGSFQKDTEGKDDMMPKLSKGPDVFVKIVEDIKKNSNKEVFVLLTGWRRNYVMRELDKINVKYVFYELIDLDVLNELYNCLDLYLVSSRVEGGPRAIIECGLARVPLISTNVGMSELILPSESIYDVENYLTYRDAKPNIEYAYDKAYNLTIKNYMKEFCEKVFYEINI